MPQIGTPEQYFGSVAQVAVRQPIQTIVTEPIEARVIEPIQVITDTTDFSWDNVLKAIALMGTISIILYVFYITYKGK